VFRVNLAAESDKMLLISLYLLLRISFPGAGLLFEAERVKPTSHAKTIFFA
jgi:hypothetical protein